jgi:hypothetical protein
MQLMVAFALSFSIQARTLPEAMIEEVELIALDATKNISPGQDPPEVVERSLIAKRRIAELGEDSDFAVARVIALALEDWKKYTGTDTVPVSRARNHAHSLMKAVRNDSKLAKVLLPAYEDWIDFVASERIPHPPLAITEEAATYLMRWGDDKQRSKLAAGVAMLAKSENVNLTGIARNLRVILEGKQEFELPPAPKTAFHQWCKESAAAINADRAPSAAMSQALKPIQPSIATQSPPALNPKPSPTPKAPDAKPALASEEPTSSTSWLVWAVLIVAAIGLLWLVLKNRK